MAPSAVRAPAGNGEENDFVRLRHQALLARRARPLLVLLLATGGSSLAAPAWIGAQGTWTATSTTGAPTARHGHTAVWTGSRMIVWGGVDVSGFVSTGGIYDPATDTWTATSTTGAPGPRSSHTGVWTGSVLIVWGGDDGASKLNTGGIYDPATNTWTPTTTTGAPTPRGSHTAVWAGSRMIVWGGDDGSSRVNTGGIYDPATDSWTATSTTVPPTPRGAHTAVWTGSRMIVWGGDDGVSTLSTGGIYDPATDSWTATSTLGAPPAWQGGTAVWTGSRMIVWGGAGGAGGIMDYTTGGIYDPATTTWTRQFLQAGPIPGFRTAVWTGFRMVLWGGYWVRGLGPSFPGNVDIYGPGTDSWEGAGATGAIPAGRSGHTAVWTGSRMIVWGGSNFWTGSLFDTGGIYDDASLLGGGGFYTVTPCRVADTRNPAGPSGGPALGANTTRSFPVTGLCGVPSTATAVAINLTVVDETDFGHLRLYATGAVMLDSSTINFTAYKVRANNGVIPLGTGGEISVRCDMRPYSTGQTHFLFDVTGYFE